MDIQHASTLEDGLAHYFRRERLDGDNAYKCEKCKSKVPANKKFSLERAPNVLCIQLKRFGLMGGKMSKHIQFSRTLNLSRFLFNQPAAGTANSGIGGGSAYKFVSLINHMGPSQHCGHYTAIAEASNGNLYLFDDCSVRLINVNTALSTGAYVLIYERIPPTAGASPAPTASGASLANGSAKANGFHSANPPIATAAPPPPKPMIPRPALISEPSRPKVILSFKKSSEQVQEQQQKPRLVMRNGASLFKTAATLGPLQPTPSGSQTNGDQKPVTPSKAAPVVAASVSPAKPSTVVKPPAALVPYDGESSDEELEKQESAAAAPSTSSNGTENLVAKASETKWQVSPSPTPSETNGNGSAVPSNSTASKWRVSENNQQDNTSNGTSSSNGSGHGKWNVRSLSDTESDRANPSLCEPKPYHSDNEADQKPSSSSPSIDPVVLSTQATPSAAHNTPIKCEPTKSPPAGETGTNIRTSPRVPSPRKEEKSSPMEATSPRPIAVDTATPVETPTKCNSNPKWDGSRGNDTVKELLRNSHSGFSDQGIKAHFWMFSIIFVC